MKNEMNREKKKRFRSLKTKFRRQASLCNYYRDVPEEAQDRIIEAFERLIESIVEIDYTNELSPDYIHNYYVCPIVEYAFVVEDDKYETIVKSEESKISRGKMNDPEIRRKVLEDLFHRQASLCTYYQNVPEEARMRISKAFERYIKSIVDIMDIDGAEMLQLPIDYIFRYYILPLIEFAFVVEVKNKP